MCKRANSHVLVMWANVVFMAFNDRHNYRRWNVRSRRRANVKFYIFLWHFFVVIGENMRGNVSRLKSNFSYLKLDYLMPLQKIGHSLPPELRIIVKAIPVLIFLICICTGEKNLLAHYRHSPIFCGPGILKNWKFPEFLHAHKITLVAEALCEKKCIYLPILS